MDDRRRMTEDGRRSPVIGPLASGSAMNRFSIYQLTSTIPTWPYNPQP